MFAEFIQTAKTQGLFNPAPAPAPAASAQTLSVITPSKVPEQYKISSLEIDHVVAKIQGFQGSPILPTDTPPPQPIVTRPSSAEVIEAPTISRNIQLHCAREIQELNAERENRHNKHSTNEWLVPGLGKNILQYIVAAIELMEGDHSPYGNSVGSAWAS